MENAKKFFEETVKTEEAKALFDSVKKPENDEERIAAYLDIAAKLGTELSKDEIVAYFDEKLKSSTTSGEIDDEEMAQVSGGRGCYCSNNFKNHENCWWNDACDYVVNDYESYLCAWSNKGACALINVSDDANGSNGTSSGIASEINPGNKPLN